MFIAAVHVSLILTFPNVGLLSLYAMPFIGCSLEVFENVSENIILWELFL